MKFLQKKGFTFIEMVVVMGVIALVLPAMFGILYGILSQQVKIMRVSEVKRQGDFTLSVVSGIIRDYAISIYSDQALTTPVCDATGTTHTSTGGSTFYFKDISGQYVNFSLVGNKISSGSAALAAPVNLTNDKVTISTFILTCDRAGTFSSPVVTIQFTVNYTTSSTRPEEIASLQYQTKVKLRTF